MKLRFSFAIVFLASALTFCQGWMMGGNFNPDSLKLVTLTGKVTADSSMMNGMYYLDVNNDTKPDYILNFGPYWYKPDSSKAVRPKVGDMITITGGLFNGMINITPMVVVYTINGNFWRSPNDAYWNNMGFGSMMGGSQHMGMGYAFGMNHDSLKVVNLNGTILADSTFMYNHFYLDTNNDGKPDYNLNFGPPWYVPASGAKLPKSGDKVTISGWEMGTSYMNMVIVNKLNGKIWRDSTQMGYNMGGGWIRKNMTMSQRFFNPFDTTDWMEVNPGWNQGGMMGGGGMMPDSLFCQILEVFPKDVPSADGQNTIAAFEVATFLPNGMNGMSQSGGMGGQMNFASMVKYQFHFTNMQSNGFNTNSGQLKVKNWDAQNNKWNEVSNAVVNSTAGTISVSQNGVSNFYIVTADKLTDVKEVNNTVPDNFSLKQNYPNPFNPSTTIEFSLKENSNVKLSIYNILGQKVVTLIDGQMNAGAHIYQFNASNLSSGIYFYQLTAGENSKIMKMELLK